MGSPPARSTASLLVVVRTGNDLNERTIDAVMAARSRDDKVVIARPSGASGEVHPTAVRRLRADVIDEREAPALLATEAAAGRTVVVVDDGAFGLDRGWLQGLAAAVPEGGVALPCTNAAPWPACPEDLPDARARRSEWRDFARSLVGRPAVPVADAAALGGSSIALHPSAVTELWAVATTAPTDLAPAGLAAAAARHRAPVVRTGAVYVHDGRVEVLLSACLIMKDEVANLERCLTSVRPVVDEIVVYDTGSTDGSIELARSLGAVVIEGMWDDDFSRARNEARARCRGTWLLHIDADEKLEDPPTARRLRDVIASDLPADLVALPLHNMRGTELAPVRDANPHWVPRIVHRARCRWTGALHEHPMPVTGGLPRTVRGHNVTLVHYGYLDEVVARLDKPQRNARIAATKLDEHAEAGRTHFDRGRTAAMNGRVNEAVEEYEQAVATATNPVHRRCAMELAAVALLNVGRAEEALPWIERRAEVPDNPGVARWLLARYSLGLGRYQDALDHLDGITDYADNFSPNGEDGVHHMRAEALAGLQRYDDAGRELVAAVAVNPTYDRAWFALMKGADRWPGAITEAARRLERDQLKLLAARLLKAPTPLGSIVAEALWEAHPAAPVLLAVGVQLGPKLDLEDAARWSIRLRSAGLANRCPLRAIAADDAAPAVVRLKAAYLGAELFGDPDLTALVSELSTLVDAPAAT